MSFNLAKQQALAAWDNTLDWTQKRSLQLPKFHQFLYAIFTRQRGALRFDERRKLFRKLGSHDFLVITALSLAYFCGVFSRVAVSVLAPELQLDPELSYDSNKHGQVIVTVQVCSMVGKLVTGFIIDMTNPRYMFILFLIGSAISTLVMSFVHTAVPDQSQRFAFIQGLAALNALFQSGTWTASAKFIHDHFRPAQFGRAIVVLGVFSKLGSVFSLLILNAFVTSGNLLWFDAHRFASGITLFGCFGVLFTFLYPHPAPGLAARTPEEHQKKKNHLDALAPSDAELHPYKDWGFSSEKVRYYLHFANLSLVRWLGWWSKRQFVLVAVANASMAVVCSVEGFEAFLTLFFFNGMKVSSQVASQAAIVLPLGVAVSLLIGGYWIERLDRPSKADIVIYMLLIAAIFSVILLVLTGSAEAVIQQSTLEDTSGFLAGIIVCIFFIGIFMGYAFYVPISTFAMIFGGEHAALATATLSVFASCVGAGFSAGVGALAAVSWTAVTGIVAAFAILAFISMTLFYYFELVDKRKAIAEAQSHTVMGTFQELVLHQPQFEQKTTDSVNSASFFHDHTTPAQEIKKSSTTVDGSPAVQDDPGEQASSSSVQSMTPFERWKHLVQKHGPGLRPDANRKVSIRIACLFFSFFLAFGIAAFGSYFAARSDPNFVYPFGDVQFANRSLSNTG